VTQNFSGYIVKISEYVNLGYARIIPATALAPGKRTWYIPHHATKGKFRIVFDCAASYKGTSLNDNLLQGPDQTSQLVGVLLRFRSKPVAVMADVTGMFHQVKVHPVDCDSLRFLWWTNGDISKDPVDYQMLVHLFGATLSPGVCSYALRKAALDNETGADRDRKVVFK